MSDLDVLSQVINTLDNIEVPAKYVEKIGIPISNSSNILKALRKALMELIERKKNEEPETPATAEPVAEEVKTEAEAETPFEKPAEN